MHGCENTEIAQTVDKRIEKTTGFSAQNMEFYQILRYNSAQVCCRPWLYQRDLSPHACRCACRRIARCGPPSAW
jgi:hypothetical protein